MPLNYIPDSVTVGNGEGSFTELKRFGMPSGGLGPDNRIGIYGGDSWKVKPNLTLNFGLRYDRDTGRTDSDLPLPEINNFFPGVGDRVRNPNLNFAPQAGFAWDPKSDGKTVIRGGVGIYYDNTVFNDVLFDRLLRLPAGAFNATQTACGGVGSGSGVTFADGTVHWLGGFVGSATSNPAANAVCGTPIGGTVSALGGDCAGQIYANCVAAFQNQVEASFAASPNGSNPFYIPGALQGSGVILSGAGMLDPNYKSPRSVQMNIGVQRELRPGMVFSADFVRNVGLHYLLATDINHSGDVANFDPNLALAAISTTNSSFGCAGTDAAAINCAIGKGALITDYAGNGLDSAYDRGPVPCTACAFQTNNRNVRRLWSVPFGWPIRLQRLGPQAGAKRPASVHRR